MSALNTWPCCGAPIPALSWSVHLCCGPGTYRPPSRAVVQAALAAARAERAEPKSAPPKSADPEAPAPQLSFLLGDSPARRAR